MSLKDTTLPHGSGINGNQSIGTLKDTKIAYLTLTMQRQADLMPPQRQALPGSIVFPQSVGIDRELFGHPTSYPHPNKDNIEFA